MQTRGNFDCRYKNGRTLPDFVLCEEDCLNRLFDSRDNFQAAKPSSRGRA